jgi:hypothetical protein
MAGLPPGAYMSQEDDTWVSGVYMRAPETTPGWTQLLRLAPNHRFQYTQLRPQGPIAATGSWGQSSGFITISADPLGPPAGAIVRPLIFLPAGFRRTADGGLDAVPLGADTTSSDMDSGAWGQHFLRVGAHEVR